MQQLQVHRFNVVLAESWLYMEFLDFAFYMAGSVPREGY